MIHLVVPTHKTGGVYDFARKLHEKFGDDLSRLVHLSKENASNWNVGPEDVVILQFSGYGFDKRGAPLWLLREIEKRRSGIKTFGVYFHELYAFGPPWTSSFWLSPVQRHIARRLAEMSDFWMTSRHDSAQWLHRYAPDKPKAVLPVFSTIGEPDFLAQVRLPRVVVFGSPGLRERTYLTAGEKLFDWAQKASLEIHDIGAPIINPRLAENLRNKGVVHHDYVNDEGIRCLMQNARFGLLAYSVNSVAKSSVFAAFCSHGLCPVLISESDSLVDGLVAGSHYLPAVPDVSDFSEAEAIGQSALRWYKSHALKYHVNTLKYFINGY